MVAVLLLTACAATGKSEQAQQPPVQAAAAQPDDDAACQAQGLQPGSSAYVQCRKKLDAQHVKEDADPSWTPERENTVRGLLGRPPQGF